MNEEKNIDYLKEDEPSFLSCDPEKFDCKDCVWAFVHGIRPTCNYCGKYARKPKHVYFGNQPCPKKQAFKK